MRYGLGSEDGCIVYEFLQDPFDPDSFTFYERWRSREDLELLIRHFLVRIGRERGRALRLAVTEDSRRGGAMPSTKGTL